MSLNAIATSAFGRRPVTRAQIEAQLAVAEARAHAGGQGVTNGAGAVHKWTLLRTLGEIRDGLGVSDRALSVLSALLSFHPETALTLGPEPELGQDDDAAAGAYAGLVVFPSNRALSLRCNGMSEPTLRRHLAALVEAGLILRRDSPNGKRYARREAGAGVSQAFGFDLAPLVARADEFDARLETLRAEQRRARLLKERINLLRRDLAKRLAFALDEGLAGPWQALRQAFLALCTPLRKLRGVSDFAALARDLDRLQDEVTTGLTQAFTAPQTETVPLKINGDGDHSDRRLSESNSEQFPEFEPPSKRAGGDAGPLTAVATPASMAAPRDLPLPVVLDACRDVEDYNFSGERIAAWRDFVDVAATIRPMLGISPDAWRDAVETLGETQAAVAVAFILQRSEHSSEAQTLAGAEGRVVVAVNGSPAIRSPGGYLRALTEKGREGALPLWPALLAHLAQRAKQQGGRARSGVAR